MYLEICVQIGCTRTLCGTWDFRFSGANHSACRQTLQFPYNSTIQVKKLLLFRVWMMKVGIESYLMDLTRDVSNDHRRPSPDEHGLDSHSTIHVINSLLEFFGLSMC